MKITTILVLTLGFAAAGARADTLYVGGSLGASRFDGTADADQPDFVGQIPDRLSINGLPFESTETAWSIYGGWQIKRWIALELGFTDLGNSGEEMITAIFGGDPFGGGPGVALLSSRSLSIEEWYLGTRFSAPLSRNVSADWVVGLTRAQFDVQGGIPILIALSPVPQIESIPFTSPDDETGLTWGFGFNWKFHERARIGIEYRQHNTRVLDVDTLSLGATFLIM
jgi:hypothetical protein